MQLHRVQPLCSERVFGGRSVSRWPCSISSSSRDATRERCAFSATLKVLMIYVHSLGRAARYFPQCTALAANGTRSTFRELHNRVGRIAAALTKHGFKAGDRLAILLPNEPDYIQLVYACAWLGVVAVPLNTRLSVKEIDGILDDAQPRGLIRHSSLPAPTVQVSWQRVLDQQPLELESRSLPKPIYDPDAILALIYTSG